MEEKMKKQENEYGNCAECNKELTMLGALLWDNSGVLCNDCDMTKMVIPNLKTYYAGSHKNND